MDGASFEKAVTYTGLVDRQMSATSTFARSMGSSLNELLVLISVRYADTPYECRHEGCTQQEICQRFPYAPKQTINAAVKKLERNGLVELEPLPGDARARMVRFTDAGEQYADRLLNDYVDALLAVVSHFTDEEMSLLTRLTYRFDKLMEAEFGIKRTGPLVELPELLEPE